MEARESLEAARAFGREHQAHHPLVVAIAPANNEPGRLRAVDQLDGAVMTKQQRGRDIANGRTTWIAAPADGQQELMLRGSESRTRGLFLTPAKEATQPDPERQQPLVVGVVQGSRHHSIVTRHDLPPTW